MIDQYTMFVNQDGRENLGDWIGRQTAKNLTGKYNAAVKVIPQCGVPVDELHHQWDLQKAAQTSIRARKFTVRWIRHITCPPPRSGGQIRLDPPD
jgi:hypothetical protein